MITAFLIAGAVLLAAGAVELAARWLLRRDRKYYVWAPYYRREFDVDPRVCGNLPRHVRFYANSDGDRGEEAPRDGGRVYRILVAGGSAPECYVLDHEDAWPLRLQRLLERDPRPLAASRVHVGNIGKSGVGAEALAFLLGKTLQTRDRYDAIVIMVAATDVFQWLQAGAPETPVRVIRSERDGAKFFAWAPGKPFGWSPRNTAAAEAFRRMRQRIVRPVERRGESCKWLLRAREMRRNASEVRTRAANADAMADNFEAYLRQAVAAAKTKADRVIVAQQPWWAQEDHPEWHNLWHGGVGNIVRGHVTTFYSSEVLCDLMERLHERAGRVAAALGVETCDTQPALSPGSMYFYDLIHFTSAGSEAVAGALAAAIRKDHTSAAAAAGSAVAGASGMSTLR